MFSGKIAPVGWFSEFAQVQILLELVTILDVSARGRKRLSLGALTFWRRGSRFPIFVAPTIARKMLNDFAIAQELGRFNTGIYLRLW